MQKPFHKINNRKEKKRKNRSEFAPKEEIQKKSASEINLMERLKSVENKGSAHDLKTFELREGSVKKVKGF